MRGFNLKNTMKSIVRMIATAGLALVLSLPVHAAEQSSIQVLVDGQPVVWTDAIPFANKDSRTMVPLRATAEAMGLDVVWDAENGRAVFSKSYDEFTLSVEFIPRIYAFVVKDGIHFDETKYMDTATEAINGRVYAPVRFLAEEFGYQVDWDTMNNAVVMASGQPLPSQRERPTKFVVDGVDADAIYAAIAQAGDDYQAEYEIIFSGCKSREEAKQVRRTIIAKHQEARPELNFGKYSASNRYVLEGVSTTVTVCGARTEAGESCTEIAFRDGLQLMQQMMAEGLLTEGMTEYEKAKCIYDKLLEIYTYDKSDDYVASAWSVFERNRGNCSGYTSAYNMLLRFCGIKCKGQGGYADQGSHLWSVALLDGRECHIDVVAEKFDVSPEYQKAICPVWDEAVEYE